MGPVYRAVLRFYPKEYRAILAPEMIGTFEQAAAERRGHGAGALLRFSLTELAGLVDGLIVEWTAKWTTRKGYLTSSYSRIAEGELPTDVMEIQKQIERSIRCMEFAIARHDFPRARYYSSQERAMRERLEHADA